MSQDHEFPKAFRENLGPVQTALTDALGSAVEAEFLVDVMSDMDARARDLAEIARRLTQPGLGRPELRELLRAFQLTGESLQTGADLLGDKILVAVDRLEETTTTSKAVGA